jgi:hypothetical protein
LCGLVTFHIEQPRRGTQPFLAFFILPLYSKNRKLQIVLGSNEQ